MTFMKWAFHYKTPDWVSTVIIITFMVLAFISLTGAILLLIIGLWYIVLFIILIVAYFVINKMIRLYNSRP